MSEVMMNNITRYSPASSLDVYMQFISKIPVLTKDEEIELIKKYKEKNDVAAAKKLILSNLRFVVYISKNYLGYGLPQADLIQEGNIGLIKSLEKFKLSYGVKFITFAAYWIKAEMHEFIIKNWRIVKIATTKAQRKLFFNFRKTMKNFNWLSSAETKNMSESLNVKEQDVKTIEQRFYSPDAQIEDCNIEDNENNPLVLYENVEQEKIKNTLKERLLKTLSTLDERLVDIIKSRWLAVPKSTLSDLAKKYNISIERVRQLEESALKLIKNKLKGS